MNESKLKVKFVDNSNSQYEGCANEISLTDSLGQSPFKESRKKEITPSRGKLYLGDLSSGKQVNNFIMLKQALSASYSIISALTIIARNFDAPRYIGINCFCLHA